MKARYIPCRRATMFNKRIARKKTVATNKKWPKLINCCVQAHDSPFSISSQTREPGNVY
jgi:hypothetical protein